MRQALLGKGRALRQGPLGRGGPWLGRESARERCALKRLRGAGSCGGQKARGGVGGRGRPSKRNPLKGQSFLASSRFSGTDFCLSS